MFDDVCSIFELNVTTIQNESIIDNNNKIQKFDN
jgi:hypothetical protein